VRGVGTKLVYVSHALRTCTLTEQREPKFGFTKRLYTEHLEGCEGKPKDQEVPVQWYFVTPEDHEG
jgi:hypothetical protein